MVNGPEAYGAPDRALILPPQTAVKHVPRRGWRERGQLNFEGGR